MRLEVNGTEVIENPTARQIIDALSGLDREDAFAILSGHGEAFVQCSGTRDLGFDLNYCLGPDHEQLRAADGLLLLDAVTYIFTEYARGNMDWQHEFSWEPLLNTVESESWDIPPERPEPLVEVTQGTIVIGRSWFLNGLGIILLCLGLGGFLTDILPTGGWRSSWIAVPIALFIIARRSPSEKRGYRF